MKWRFHLTRIAGIDIYLHATFLVLLALLLYAAYVSGGGWSAVVERFAFVTLLFAIVVMHEYGHVLAARRYGIGTRDIVLYPIGGVASLERMPEKPAQELVVAIAGPAVNVVLAAVLFVINALIGNTMLPQALPWETNTLQQLMWINITLVVFNMLPAYPMDGGRVLRALLAMVMPPVRATAWAAHVGRIMAIAFIVAGMYFNVLLAVIGIFVWLAASQEYEWTRTLTALHGIRASQAMATGFAVLDTEDALQSALEHIAGGINEDFPVTHHGAVVGMLSRQEAAAAALAKGPAARVREVMHASPATARPEEPLDQVLRRFEGSQYGALPVVSGGAIVGVLSLEGIRDFITVRLQGGRRD